MLYLGISTFEFLPGSEHHRAGTWVFFLGLPPTPPSESFCLVLNHVAMLQKLQRPTRVTRSKVAPNMTGPIKKAILSYVKKAQSVLMKGDCRLNIGYAT